MGVPFSNYLNSMNVYGAFGDKITLRVAAQLFSVEFVIISALGRAAEATITPENFIPQGRVNTLFFIQLKIPVTLMNLLFLK